MTNNVPNRVFWIKIKVKRVEKNKPGIIQFKYNFFDEEYRSIQVDGRSRPCKILEHLKCYMKNQY